MINWLRQLDDILRGRATALPNLVEGRLEIRVGPMVAVLTLLGAIYGFFMGWFAVLNRPDGDPQYMQLLASAVKVPLLFLLTLIVTFPSLYVFNALVGSRLDSSTLVRLLIAAIAVTLTVLASFGTVIAFFTVTTESYSFILLINVAAFAVAGVLGMTFLLQTMNRLSIALHGAAPPTPAPSPEPLSESDLVVEPETPETPGALDRLEGHVLGRHVVAVFRCWVVVFALVGGQMAWVLRPYVGAPNLPFEWFRPRESNFFEGVFNALQRLVE